MLQGSCAERFLVGALSRHMLANIFCYVDMSSQTCNPKKILALLSYPIVNIIVISLAEIKIYPTFALVLFLYYNNEH